MSPLNILNRLRKLNPYHNEDHAPPLSTFTVSLLAVVYTLLYVVPLYFSKTTRPAPNINRDNPAVIRTRFRLVTASCAISIVIAVFTLSHFAQLPRSEIVQLLGWYPYPCESLKCLALTAILFAGPFFEKAIIEGRWKSWVTLQPAFNELTTVIGVRNLVFGPISEELMFRSLLVPVFLHSPQSPTTTIFVLPLYFGIAHLHHFYEFLLTHPGTPWQHALIRSIFQFSYTTLFGWYGTFLFIRTRSFVGVTLAHSFCNFMGLPRFWGRVEGPDSATSHDKRRGVGQNTTRLNILWSVAYYIVLVAGAVLFKQNFWSLTESEMRLAVI